MAAITLRGNLETGEIRRVRAKPQRRKRWVAIQPDGTRYIMHKQNGVWYYRTDVGAGPGIAQAIQSAADEGIRIVEEAL